MGKDALFYIKFIKDSGFCSIGDICPVVAECKDHYYYYDIEERYCYLPKSELGVTFEVASDVYGVSGE